LDAPWTAAAPADRPGGIAAATEGVRGKSLALRFAGIGAILGLGGPGGALLLRVLAGARVFAELRDHSFYYLYSLLGTCIAFAAAGYLAGRRADRLRSGRDQYRRLSELDSLTRLANAQTFRRHYVRSLQHAARSSEPLSLLMIDVDGLKSLNDELGHSFGSAVLLHVARVLEECTRVGDLAARWGGDEFTLLMPGTDAATATRRAQDILRQLGARPVRADGRERTITATIGVATSRGAGDDLFEVADRALYAGKRAGRGQVRAAEA
jgi:diguanylate cyclase (GGDEF)-like protein